MRLSPFALLVAALVVVPAGPALADHNITHTRTQACPAAGGTVSGPGTSTPSTAQPDNQRCTVITSVDSAPVPSGTPTTTLGEPTAVGEPTSVTQTFPVGEPTVEEETVDV